MSITRKTIQTQAAPQAIGSYSQAVQVGETVYLSGQIALDPATMQLVSGDIHAEIRRVFENLAAVAAAAGGSLASAVKLTVYLTDMALFAAVSEIMASYFSAPYPARVTVGVAQLPRGARVEIEGILHLG
jgi:reactive intermediate/imine deaminase